MGTSIYSVFHDAKNISKSLIIFYKQPWSMFVLSILTAFPKFPLALH